MIIDNDRKLNVLNSQLMAQLASELDKLQAMEALRAVVLASAGSRAFIAGTDIKEMSSLDATSAAASLWALTGAAMPFAACLSPSSPE
ncbi:MAG: enoyl-CoA hydratase/isomerase family protein [Rhodomicrobium sp.]